MNKVTTIALLILLTGTVGASFYLLKTKNKLIAEKDASILSRDKKISGISGEHKKLTAKLAQANQAAKSGKKEYDTLKSDRDILKIKITGVESKLAAQKDGSSKTTEATEKLQEELIALKLEATEKAKQLATLETKNSSLETQVTDHLKRLQESDDALVNAEANLKPFEELGKTPDEIKKGLMKRPVTLSQPLPPRPASQAGKITEPIQLPVPLPKTSPEPTPKSAPKPAAPTPSNQP